MNQQETMRALDLNPDHPAVLLHADDVGMCHGANVAFLELSRSGALNCGSAMVPCPWFPEIASEAAGDDALDLGVHLTLTSEWTNYRWGPLTRSNSGSGLVDDAGYFHSNVAALANGVDPTAAKDEMRAQIERALGAGIDVTHLDTHMGAALCAPIFETTLRLGQEYDLPVLLPRDGKTYREVLKLEALGGGAEWDTAVALSAQNQEPLVDNFAMTPGAPEGKGAAAYRKLIDALEPGITFLALHPNFAGDIETIIPPRAHWRVEETEALRSGLIAGWLDELEIQTIGMRPFRERLRRRTSTIAFPSAK